MSERRQRSQKKRQADAEKMHANLTPTHRSRQQQLPGNSKSVENIREYKRKVDYERIFKLYKDAERMDQ